MGRMIVPERRGQIQLGETVAVVVIIVILLILGIAFWGRESGSGIVDTQKQSRALAVIEIANTLPDLPELKCYKSGVSEVKCIDMYKAISMKDAMSDDEVLKYYNNYFMNSKITLYIIYPPVPEGQEENITIYDARFNAKTDTKLIDLPVNIEDSVNGITRFGILSVEGYFKTNE